MRFALLDGCLSSSFTSRFLFSSLESVVKSNVAVFVYTKRKQKKLSVQFWSFCLRANGPVNYKWTGPLKQSMIFISYIMIWCSQFIGSSD